MYMAEQQEPVRRKVALKVIKLGMDTRQVVARFEAERQALALMDHPNIAKVLDAGATHSGRPYFVMELVRGVKITSYCDEHQCSTRERLNLFVQVCQAVQHAHQKGIIHRDLKPSNILVTERDGAPFPKVIDFGIAEATGPLRLTEKTLFTAFEQFLGTPAYMSPEQARFGELDIDTRTDIYALGVLLYELLAGRTPFETKALLASGLDQLRQTIREKHPAKPSTRLSAVPPEELTATAQRRATEPVKLIHLLRGDLDWIVMKCLEKDRARRYETASALAADVIRHLKKEPVLASPPSKLASLPDDRDTTVLRDFLDNTANEVQAHSPPESELAGYLRSTLALLYLDVGEKNKAEHMARQALAAVSGQAGDEDSTLAEPLLVLRDVLLAEHKFAEAEQVVENYCLKLPEPQRSSARFVQLRGDLRARTGQWRKAAADFSKLIELEPTNHEAYFCLAPLLVQSGDLGGYRRLCEQIRTRFGASTSDPSVANQMANSCLLLPTGGADLAIGTRLAELVAKLGRGRSNEAWCQLSKSLSEYRQGRYGKATENVLRVLKDQGQRPRRDVEAYMILAMANYQLARLGEAHAAFGKGAAIARKEMPSLEDTDLTGGWVDWLVAYTLMREARALLENGSHLE